MEDIVVIGYGGHAMSVADTIVRQGIYSIAGYTDIEDSNCKYEYLGTDEELTSVYNRGVHSAILGVGYVGESALRDKLYKIAKKIGYRFPVIIDPSAVISEDVSIGEGSFVGKNAVVNAGATIGMNCIINTGSVIEHENIIGDYSHVSVGTILCGEVTVGHHSLVGAGATVIQCKTIGNNCIVGANSTVLSDVEDNMKVVGVVKDGESA